PAESSGQVLTATAQFTQPTQNAPARLFITAEMAPGHHIYSITQPDGGPLASRLKLEASGDFKRVGDFKPWPEPKRELSDVFKKAGSDEPLLLEEHFNSVTWHVPIELARGVDPKNLRISGSVYAQVCNASGCLPPKDYRFVGRLGPGADIPAAELEPPAEQAPETQPAPDVQPPPRATTVSYTHPRSGTVLHGRIEPRVAVPGGQARLVLTAEPAEGWYVYELGTKAPDIGSQPTLITLTQTSGLEPRKAVPSYEPVRKQGEELGHHERPVDWTIELAVPQTAQPGPLTIAGLIGYQSCNAGGCERPEALSFEGTLAIGGDQVDGATPITFTGLRGYAAAQDPSAAGLSPVRGGLPGAPAESLALDKIRAQTLSRNQPLILMMALGFLGGLILNLMPCVLPVIGLKVLSFVEQGGHDRRQVFVLNVWYALGLIFVFLVLATLPVVSRLVWNQQFGWGQQFASDGFNITLAAIVFVMALSFLGVWEIPIPGFIGGSKTTALAAKEGVAGAFCKGAITTVLATPCTGPFLGSALGFAASQPPHITYLIFASMGVGMASPYLLIGAFPTLLRFLPKPGAWMDTFKQMMGFLLLGTVVFLMTFMEPTSIVPTVALLMGLWAACWWIGRTPLFADGAVRTRAWLGAGAFAVLVGLTAFQWLAPIMAARHQRDIERAIAETLRGSVTRGAPTIGNTRGHELPWRPFSLTMLEDLAGQQKTVLVDFTADWCATCKFLEQTVLNTKGTRKVVLANNVVPLIADMTRWPDEESALLEALSGGGHVPVLAIFPAGRPNEPIVLKDTYTQALLLDKLKQAGPSKQAAAKTTAMH
ncbi:MAG: cytochrome c biogenesis protein CcdA, partial [Pirellulales bacterium]